MLRTCQILPVDSGYGHGCKTTKGASVNEGVFCRKQLGVILMSFLSFVCALSRIRSFCVQSCPIIVDVTVPNCNRWKTCFGIHLQKLSKMIMNYQKLSETKYHGLVVFNCYRNKGYCSQKIDCLEAWRTLNLHQVARMLGLPVYLHVEGFFAQTLSQDSQDLYLAIVTGLHAIESWSSALKSCQKISGKWLVKADLISHQNCQCFCQRISVNIAKLRNTADKGR